jgi:hypothetical protein
MAKSMLETSAQLVMLNNAVSSFQTELLELRQKINGAVADLNNAREKYK